MDKKAVISLKGIHTDIENKTSTIELMSEAKFYKKDSSYYIVYKETEITGMEGTTTTIKISGNIVNIIRFGTICTNLTFKAGEAYACDYNTAYGLFNVSITAKELRININDSGGDLYIDYDVELGGELLGYNNFYIKIVELSDND